MFLEEWMGGDETKHQRREQCFNFKHWYLWLWRITNITSHVYWWKDGEGSCPTLVKLLYLWFIPVDWSAYTKESGIWGKHELVLVPKHMMVTRAVFTEKQSTVQRQKWSTDVGRQRGQVTAKCWEIGGKKSLVMTTLWMRYFSIKQQHFALSTFYSNGLGHESVDLLVNLCEYFT